MFKHKVSSIFIAGLLILCMTSSVLALSSQENYTIVTPEKASDIIESQATVIDVRSPADYAIGHIEGAISVPFENFNIDNFLLLNLDKNSVILLYCSSGHRSNVAANMLAESGYSSLYSLDGGLSNWIAVYGDDSLQECSECGFCSDREVNVDYKAIEGSELNRTIAKTLVKRDVKNLIQSLKSEGLKVTRNFFYAAKIFEEDEEIGKSIVLPLVESGNSTPRVGLLFHIVGPYGEKTWAVIYDNPESSVASDTLEMLDVAIVNEGSVYFLSNMEGEMQMQQDWWNDILCIVYCGLDADPFCGAVCSACLIVPTVANPACAACAGCVVIYAWYCYEDCLR